MSKDDWSLKGKKHLGYDCLGEKLRCWSGEHMDVYNSIDIDTLRQKLIEDIGKYPFPPSPSNSSSLRLDLIRIINRRFGYEES